MSEYCRTAAANASNWNNVSFSHAFASQLKTSHALFLNSQRLLLLKVYIVGFSKPQCAERWEAITDLRNKLDPRQFVRIHRSSIGDLDRIREIYREGRGDGSIVLTDRKKLRMSKVGHQQLVELGKV
jgi:hypothetical protein